MSSRGTSTSTRSRLNILSLNSKNNKKFTFKPHTDMTDTYSVVLPASIGSTDSTDKVLKIDSSANSSAICDWSYPGVEQHSTSTSPITFKVTVATKTNTTHRYLDSGSDLGYFIDGKPSPYIDMIPGKTYRFDQSHSSNNTHPIKFYTTADKSEVYTTGVTPNGNAGTTGAYVEIVVSDSTPALLFYQCQSHGLMGNQIQVKGVGGGGGGGSALTIQDEGSALSTAATTLNFVGSGVTASGTGAEKTITISGGGGGTSLPSQTGNANKFLKTDGSSLTWATPSGFGSGGSPIYAHLQPVQRDVDNSINDNEVEYLPIDNSKPPEGVSSYSVGGITLTTDSKGIKLPSNGDYKMDFNINVRKNGNATEFWGTLCQGNNVIQVTSTSIRQVDGTTYSTLVLPAIVKVEDYANEVYKFKVGAGQLTNSGEVWGVELPEYPNTVTGSQVTIMKVSDMGGSALTVKDENTALTTAATTLKFVGDGVTASGTGAEKTITISGGGSSPDAFPSVTLPNDKQLQYKMLTGRVLINIPGISGSTYSIENGATLFNDGTSDLEATITPSTSSSQILVSVNLFGEAEYPLRTFMTLQKTVNGVSTLIKPSGNTSTLGLFSFRHEYPSGTAEYSSTAEAGCFRYVDVLSSQLPVTYKVVLCNEGTSSVKFWTNGSEDLATQDRGLSIITAQEVSSARSFTTANPLLANPSTTDKGKIVTVNSTGTDLQYGPKVLKHNMNFKNIYEHGSFQIPASTANNNPAVHPVMNITITPQLTTSKVMITVNIMGEIVDDRTWDTVAYLRKTINGVSTDILPPQDSQNTNGNRGLGQFVRTYQETNSHSTMEVCNFHYIDEPNTISTVTYNVLIVCNVLRSFKYNRTASHEDNPRRNNADAEFGMSFISAEEKFANDDGAVGAITSFTQEQALAGAGGTAAFTAYGIKNTSYLTSSDYHTGHVISNLYDNYLRRAGTVVAISSSSDTVSFAYDFSTPQIVTKYRIWPRATSVDNDVQAPSSWQLRAATTKTLYDAGTYTILDSHTGLGELDWDQTIVYNGTATELNSDNLSKANEYNLATIGAYKYYVLHITSVVNISAGSGLGGLLSLGEFALYGGGFTIPSQVGNAGKQLITNGTSLTWGSPSSILVPSPTGNANKVLQANSQGTGLEYGDPVASDTVVGFFVQPTATVTGTYGTDGAGADYSLSGVNKTYPLQQWTIKGYGGYYMNNSNPRFGFNSGHFDCTSNSGGKFTAPSNGNYYISFNIEVTTITGWYHTIGIYINGNPANGGTVLPNNGSGAGNYGFSSSRHHIGGVNSDPDTFNTNFHKPHNYTESFIINLQQNDYVQLVVYSRNDPTYIIGKDSYFCIYKM